jgi:hypothetical protein
VSLVGRDEGALATTGVADDESFAVDRVADHRGGAGERDHAGERGEPEAPALQLAVLVLELLDAQGQIVRLLSHGYLQFGCAIARMGAAL